MTISAKIIADSIGVDAPRITTLQLRYPRFIHAELMTHRVFSRNASSSRAIPVARLIKDVIDDPVYPSYWGKNQKGMQANEECNEPVKVYSPGMDLWYDLTREQAWDRARENAIHMAEYFDKAGYHKQIVNRLLEPFSHINVVVTSTRWANWDRLRDHKDAMPEIQILARAMKAARNESNPTLLGHNEWHLPYILPEDIDRYPVEQLLKVSVARCARVSYKTHEGKPTQWEDDLKIYNQLLVRGINDDAPLHASPAEHPAKPDHRVENPYLQGWNQPEYHGNFHGWIQYRKTIPNECYYGDEE